MPTTSRAKSLALSLLLTVLPVLLAALSAWATDHQAELPAIVVAIIALSREIPKYLQQNDVTRALDPPKPDTPPPADGRVA